MSISKKRLNRQSVLNYIFSKETVSRTQIAYDLKMSMPTVLQNINELQELGLVCEAGQYESTGGRKASVLARVPDFKLAAGIDITRNHIGLVLVNLAGEILRHERIVRPYSNTADYYEKLGTLIGEFVGRTRGAEKKLLGVGISVPGILDADARQITYSHALDIRNLPCEIISRTIPWPCFFMNDANAAGTAELRKHGSQSTMVYLSLSNSVGGAVFMDGMLYRGTNQRSGEFGHMKLVPDGKQCYCGQHGCLDSYCSSLVLANCANGSLESFFDALQSGDRPCSKVWDEYLTNLSYAVVNLRMCFDCTVILGGYVGARLEPWIGELRRRTDSLTPFEQGGAYILPCRYRYEASAFGAAMQPVSRYLEHL